MLENRDAFTVTRIIINHVDNDDVNSNKHRSIDNDEYD